MTGAPEVRHSAVEAGFEPREAVARLGMILLATDLTSERDAARVIPAERAAVHVTRIAYDNPTTPETLRETAPRLADAAALLAPVPGLKAICYSCTSAAIEIGDAGIAEAIGKACPGVPVVTPPGAALEAFRALGVRRINLLTPYLPQTTAPMAAHFAAAGLQVANAECLGIEDDRDMARVRDGDIVAAAQAADRPDAEGLFISCTALPALGLIPELERLLGKPVVTSNQASLWRMLHHAGLAPREGAGGRLFEVSPA